MIQSWAWLCVAISLVTSSWASDRTPSLGNPWQKHSRSFTIANDTFLLDGEPILLRSVEVHYQRIHPAYWRDRLLRLKAMGANAVQVYVPWNLHQPSPDVVNYEGFANLPAFLSLLAEMDFLVLFRPGPYICAEWDFGGLPYWLLREDPDIKIRTNYPTYMKYVESWWSQLLTMANQFTVQNGGPIIMMQVENEYGSYGNVLMDENDKDYLLRLIDIAKEYMGEELILYTTDIPDPEHILRGTLPGDVVYTVVDFGPDRDYNAAFDLQKKMNPPGQSPRLCSEFYSGWLVHWGEPMASTSAVQLSTVLDEILALGGSVNLYMGHGGTNFGFWNGANIFDIPQGVYLADLTSYDYNCMLSEAGDHGFGPDGDKYAMVQEVLRKYSDGNVIDEPAAIPKTSYGTITMQQQSSLIDNVDRINQGIVSASAPMSMEALSQALGFVVYRYSNLDLPAGDNILTLRGVRDRATILLNGETVAVVLRGAVELIGTTISTPTALVGATLDIIIENLGRINYGAFMKDAKGLLFSPLLNDKPLDGQWEMFKLPLETQDLDALTFTAIASVNSPRFYRTELVIESDPMVSGDTFFDMSCWSKGVVWVNGFNLGRYWSIGAQQTLYVPAPLLHAGANDVIVLEMETPKSSLTIPTVSTPIFNTTVTACN